MHYPIGITRHIIQQIYVTAGVLTKYRFLGRLVSQLQVKRAELAILFLVYLILTFYLVYLSGFEAVSRNSLWAMSTIYQLTSFTFLIVFKQNDWLSKIYSGFRKRYCDILLRLEIFRYLNVVNTSVLMLFVRFEIDAPLWMCCYRQCSKRSTLSRDRIWSDRQTGWRAAKDPRTHCLSFVRYRCPNPVPRSISPVSRQYMLYYCIHLLPDTSFENKTKNQEWRCNNTLCSGLLKKKWLSE